jgi:hypothetical protein
MKTIAALSVCLFSIIPTTLAATDTPVTSRYPTSDETFYVLACMQMNGQNAKGLQKCSCAINAIEARLPFEQYSEAELVFAMRQAGGQGAAIYRDAAAMKEVAERFIRAQTEANQECFGREHVHMPSDSDGAATHHD